MRFRLADSASLNYLNTEAWLNNIKLILVNSGTELVLGSAIVNAAGDIVTTFPISGNVGLLVGTNNIGDVDVLTLPALVAGTANIGDVDVLTLPALVAGTANIGDVDVLTLPATPVGTNQIGAVHDVGGEIQDESDTVRTINRAFVTATGLGNTQVVAAQGGLVRIRVLSVQVITTLANSVKFQSATTDISATFPLAANGGFVMPCTQHGWFQTAANEALNVNLSLGTSTGVQVIWVQAT